MKLLLFGLLTTLLLASCSLKDRDRQIHTPRFPLSGAIQGATGKGPLYAVLYNLAPNRPEPLSHQLVARGNRYIFSAPAGRDLGVGAFEDLNRNHRQDIGEPAGFARFAKRTPAAGSTNKSIRLQCRTKRIRYPVTVPVHQVAFPSNGRAQQQVTTTKKPTIKARPKTTPGARRIVRHPAAGSVVNLADRRFSNEAADLGFADPDSFVAQHGFGLYFVDAYQRRKTPVIMIHSSGGNIQDWRALFPRLDLSRYQPMLYHYPTGMPFDRAASSLRNMVTDLGRRFRFNTIHVVGHGTGGLIGYRFVQLTAGTQGAPRVTNFVTLATPWEGLRGSARNVRRGHSSWDLRSNSAFLRSLDSEPLPRGVRHHVLISNQNRATVRSQLGRGHRAATYSFDAAERGIVGHPAAAHQINRCLGAR